MNVYNFHMLRYRTPKSIWLENYLEYKSHIPQISKNNGVNSSLIFNI